MRYVNHYGQKSSQRKRTFPRAQQGQNILAMQRNKALRHIMLLNLQHHSQLAWRPTRAKFLVGTALDFFEENNLDRHSILNSGIGHFKRVFQLNTASRQSEEIDSLLGSK